uniref:Patched family protein n=1 Tax=Parascaris univalens TaxID=6257 RepID=A0A915BH66_PARUN
MGAIDALERFIAGFFSKIGLFIGSHPLCVILCVTVATLFLSVGLVNFKEVNNVRTEYSPINAPSRIEYAIAKNFLGQNGTMDPSYIMVQARDGGSLLRDDYRRMLISLTKRLQNNVTVTYNGHTYGYIDLCEPYCEMNTAFIAFLKLYDPTNPTTFTYPAIELFGTQAFIGNNAYGVKLKNGTKLIESFTTAILPFFVVSPEEFRPLLYKWQLEARSCFNDHEYSILKIEITGDNLVSEEVRRMGFETAPILIGSIIFM